ncbi:hypothetical protein GYMLUDRAFT_88401 [Collybiopsis luxurians FD-317 M1]|uniref:Uncharacterized protein n=1 Tax=Collybiopsis luxurians FD-317 M1 TaxID=944289 RepID=A0A0D0CED4_9AGAR|nr:hypothetical protein GYMLUDRAFT_88401 [Collybiopsis luxurians FD-317 M1]
MKGERPPRPQDVWCPDVIWDLTTHCWAQIAQDRPSANEILNILQRVPGSSFIEPPTSILSKIPGEFPFIGEDMALQGGKPKEEGLKRKRDDDGDDGSSSSRNPFPFRPSPQQGYLSGPHKSNLPTFPNNTGLAPQEWYYRHLLQPHLVHQANTLQQLQQLSQQVPPPLPPPRHHPPPTAPTLTQMHSRQLVPALPSTLASSFGHMSRMLSSNVKGSIPARLAPSDILDGLSFHYRTVVVYLQYPLADKECLSRVLSEDIQNNDRFARRAARLLALIHFQRCTASIPQSIELTVKEEYKELLRMFSFAKVQFDADDALCALNVISAFLFDGGRGDWERWIRVASLYSARILEDRSRFMDYRDVITNCEDKEQFIIIRTFWFDVLASVTTMESPLFLKAIDKLYDPENQSSLLDVSEMLPIMGCIVWAFAQISSLDWEKKCRFSIFDSFSRRAADIELHLAPPDPSLKARSEDDVPRLLASEAFRTSAIVYLRTVVHGDHPLVPEIAEAVNEAIGSLEQIIAAPEKVRHVAVQSTVFPFFICAALTTKNDKRNSLLNALIDEGEVGSCRGAVELLKGLNLGTVTSKTVPWRAAIRESKMLLV